MRRHAERIARMVDDSAQGQRAPWLHALIGKRQRLPDLAHFPVDDVIDRRSGAQFFLHTHDGATHGFAHIHCFVRLPGASFGADRDTVMTHIVAVSVDPCGWPRELLAVNQWVTDEAWQPAGATVALIDRFDFAARSAHARAGRWLASVLQVHRPEIEHVLKLRDQRLQRALDRHPNRNVLTDRRMEVLASQRIDLKQRLAALLGERVRS